MGGTHGIKLWAKAFVFLLAVTECVRFLFGFLECLNVYGLRSQFLISSSLLG